MRCHDFHLSGYEVRQFGGEIVLHLEVAGEESHVRFSEVELYHFVHAGGTIIFGIEEVPVSQILDEFWERILHWAKQPVACPTGIEMIVPVIRRRSSLTVTKLGTSVLPSDLPVS